MKPLVSIIIINYNTRNLLESCVESLRAQTYGNCEIIFIDNASTDGSDQFVSGGVQSVCNNKNLGYADAGNQGISMAKGQYVMLMNPDIIFEKDYLEKCMAKMEDDKKIAAICGKIRKYDFKENRKTKLIDTVGLYCYRNRRVIDEGQGLEDKGQFDEAKEVFGVSGACPLYRKEALEDVKIPGDIALGRSGKIKKSTGATIEFGEYLDSDFFMYKEDVDISWRMRLFGWKCWYQPSAVAYHGRGTGVLKRFSTGEVLLNRGKLSSFQKYFSYKNQRLMQIKNELWSNFFHDFFSIIWKEFLMLGNMIFLEPYLWKAWWKMMAQLPQALRKRRYIMKKRRVSAKEMGKWVGGARAINKPDYVSPHLTS